AIPVATLSSAFKLLPGRLPAGTAKFEFQRTVPLIAQGIVGATPTMPNSSPSKPAAMDGVFFGGFR
ncbi:MAG TPA: hypothetical protein VE715_07930, partial [Blastocatellia bacterium]|nr:hypothetical protein [Blastocatellia bacterium]